MISFKTVLKYILGQFLFFFKNVLHPVKIDKKSIKVVFYSTIPQKKVVDKLASKGFENVINVINSSTLEATLNHSGKFIISNYNEFPETNAEIIFFTAKTLGELDSIKKKPNYIFIPFKAFVLNFSAVISFVFKRKFFFNSFKFWGNGGLLYEKKEKANGLSTRRYIPFQLSRIEFLKTLYSQKLDFVVLRWFDELETLTDPNEDIDMLINTTDVDALSKIMDNKVGILPIDLYSSTGDDETSYSGLPYYPQKLSNEILENKVVFNDAFYVPNSYYHLVSLAYHIVFHKSLSSGLSINDSDINTINNPKRDFGTIITELIKTNEIDINTVNLETLYFFLKENNFLPKYDLILKLKNLKQDTWFDYIINDARKVFLKDYDFVDGLSVFLLRENAVDVRHIENIVKCFKDYGFDLLAHSRIQEEYLEQAQSNIRGGKWDKGDYEINAGKPLHYFLIFDSFSKKPQGIYKQLYPNLENEKATKLKLALRNTINRMSEETMNAIHSSDDFFESVFYLEQLGYKPEEIKQLILPCIKLKNDQLTDYEVVNDLSRHSSRAKVELIKFNNDLAIKKTYKQSKIDYLEREIWLLNQLSNTDFVPKVLKTESNYMITEYIDNAVALDTVNARMNVKNINQFRCFFETLYSKNITILDINRSNVLLDGNGDIKIIDFEYAQEYSDKPERISEIYELGRIPLDKVSVYPFGHELYTNAYNLFWKRTIYMTKNQFFSIKKDQSIKTITAINKRLFDASYFINNSLKRTYKGFRRQFNKFLK